MVGIEALRTGRCEVVGYLYGRGRGILSKEEEREDSEEEDEADEDSADADAVRGGRGGMFCGYDAVVMVFAE